MSCVGRFDFEFGEVDKYKELFPYDAPSAPGEKKVVDLNDLTIAFKNKDGSFSACALFC